MDESVQRVDIVSRIAMSAGNEEAQGWEDSVMVSYGLINLALDTEYSVPADSGKTRPVPRPLSTTGVGPAAGSERPERNGAPGQFLWSLGSPAIT